MGGLDENTQTFIRRGGLVVLAVGSFSSIGVYLGHNWYHEAFLPALGISAALGDALGGFAIILAAYIGQRIASLLFFRDIALGSIRVTQQLRRVNQEIQTELCELDKLACTDKLTGAWNRRRLEDSLAGEIERYSRYGHPLSMLLLDIDHFKFINDRLGHPVGDMVLMEFSERLRQGLRAADMLVRWGGEEFIVLCPNTSLATATRLARRLHQTVRGTAFEGAGQVTVSIGVSEFQAGDTWDSWYARADAAVYQAKHDGRDQVHVVPNPLETADQSEAVNTGFIRLVWRAAYESGHAEIDQQHRDLFELANDLLATMMTGAPSADTAEIIKQLIHDITDHFSFEETMMRRVGYPKVEEHIALHREISAKATTLIERFQAGALEVGELFQFLARDVVVKHLLNADRDFFPWMEQQPATAP